MTKNVIGKHVSPMRFNVLAPQDNKLVKFCESRIPRVLFLYNLFVHELLNQTVTKVHTRIHINIVPKII